MNHFLSSYKQKNYWSLGFMIVAILLSLSLIVVDKSNPAIGATIITLNAVLLTLSITIGIFASKQEKYEKERGRAGYFPEHGIVMNLTNFYVDDFISRFNQIYFKPWGLVLSPGELAHQINSGYCVNLCIDVIQKLAKHGITSNIVKGGSHWFIEVKEYGALQKPFYFDAYYRFGVSNPDCISEYGANQTTVGEVLKEEGFLARFEQWTMDQTNGRGVYIAVNKLDEWKYGITNRRELARFKQLYGDSDRKLTPYPLGNGVHDKFE